MCLLMKSVWCHIETMAAEPWWGGGGGLWGSPSNENCDPKGMFDSSPRPPPILGKRSKNKWKREYKLLWILIVSYLVSLPIRSVLTLCHRIFFSSVPWKISLFQGYRLEHQGMGTVWCLWGGGATEATFTSYGECRAKIFLHALGVLIVTLCLSSMGILQPEETVVILVTMSWILMRLNLQDPAVKNSFKEVISQHLALPNVERGKV